MNTENLARCTFVLDKDTAQHLAYLSQRFRRSRSDIVREVLREPVEVMATLIRSLPEEPTEADLNQLVLSGLELVDDLAAATRTSFPDASK